MSGSWRTRSATSWASAKSRGVRHRGAPGRRLGDVGVQYRQTAGPGALRGFWRQLDVHGKAPYELGWLLKTAAICIAAMRPVK